MPSAYENICPDVVAETGEDKSWPPPQILHRRRRLYASTVASTDAGTDVGTDPGTDAGAYASTVASIDADTDVGTDTGTDDGAVASDLDLQQQRN